MPIADYPGEAGTISARHFELLLAFDCLHMESPSHPGNVVLADVKSADPLHSGRVLSLSGRLMGNLFGVLLIAMLVGPILMAVAGWKMVGSTHSPTIAAGLSKDSIAAILVGVAIVIFAVGIGMAYTVP